MKRVRVLVSVIVDTLDSQGKEMGQPQGFKVGSEQVVDPQILDNLPGILDTTVQQMLVQCLPMAYLESEKRWGEVESAEVKSA